MLDIVYVSGDEWDGVYLDGELKSEGHTIDVMEFCELIKLPLKTIRADEKWLNRRGSLPRYVRDVKGETD